MCNDLTTRGAVAVIAAATLFSWTYCSPASADAPRFPNIDSYSPVDIADYNRPITTPRRDPFDAYYFVTPDGVTCNFLSGQAQCLGNNFPGVAPAESSETPGVQTENWIGTATGLKQTSSRIHAPRPSFKALLPFHSIIVDGVICGVDDKGTTACKDGEGRGFILSPAWSGWLPKV